MEGVLPILEENHILIESFYNPNEKLKFLEYMKSQNASTNTILSYSSMFTNLYIYEKRRSKDVSEFNQQQFINVFKSLKYSSIATLKSRVSLLTTYIEYCEDENLFDCNSQIIKLNFYPTKLEKYLDFEKVKEATIYSNEEFDYIMDYGLYNAQDQVVFMLLWYGVMGKECSEIRNITLDDIDYDKQTIKINSFDEKKCYTIQYEDKYDLIIKDAVSQTEYTDRSREESHLSKIRTQMNSSNYLIRSCTRGQATQIISYTGLYRRIQNVGKNIGKDKLKPSSIVTSSILCKIEENAVDKFRPTNEEILNIMQKFSLKPTSLQAYRTKYRKFIAKKHNSTVN